MKSDPTVLIVDADKAARRLLRLVLEPEGYRIFEAGSGSSALAKVVECNPDVIILETNLPDGDGLRVLQNLQEWTYTPVLVLSEQAEEEAKVTALDAGARDYLTKPFSTAELLARLRVLLRPLPNVPNGPLLIEGELSVNLATHEVTIGGQKVRLTRKEQALLFVLARYTGKVVTRSHLLRSIWGTHSEEKAHDLIVLVGQLRKDLGPYGEILITTAGSIGYSLSVNAKQEPLLVAG